MAALSSSIPTMSAPMPALSPPPGVVSNFVDPPNKLRETNILVSICMAASTSLLIMRLYTRMVIMREVGWADCYIFIGWACSVAFTAIAYVTILNGAGIHQWDIEASKMEQYLKPLHICSVIYCVSLLFIKLAVLVQYIQIFVPVKRQGFMYWTCWILMIVNTIFYIIFTFTEIFECSPVAKAWNPAITWGHCVNVTLLDLSASAINMVSDFIILCLPQIVIWQLQRSWQRKLAVSIVFAVGIIACVSSAIRVQAAYVLYKSPDSTYYTWAIGMWGTVEQTTGIVAVCLPVSLRFFKYILDGPISHINSIFRSWAGGTGSSSLYSESDPSHHKQETPAHSQGLRVDKSVASESSCVMNMSSIGPDHPSANDAIMVTHSFQVTDHRREGSMFGSELNFRDRLPV